MSHAADMHDTHDAHADGDYHGHPNYIAIWGVLVALLVVSLVAGYLGSKMLAIVIIFAIAIVKALMVVGSFMHMRWEPRVMWALLGFGVLCAMFFFFGVYPDIVTAPVHPVPAAAPHTGLRVLFGLA